MVRIYFHDDVDNGLVDARMVRIYFHDDVDNGLVDAQIYPRRHIVIVVLWLVVPFLSGVQS